MSAFTQKQLKEMAAASAEKLRAARQTASYSELPFKHVVVDDFLDPALAQICLRQFPKPDDPGWDIANDADIEVKMRTTWRSEFDIPDGLIDAVRILNSSIFMQTMSEVMGIEKIISDPYFTGGGLNVTLPGGLLDVHVDGNYHDATGLNRRLNAIVYLNPGWQPTWGGEFGIYDHTGENCVKRVAPLFNRLVIFDSHDFSFHGLPEPLKFPEGEYRRSIILYYYTKEPRPQDQISVEKPHSALWRRRDLSDKKGNKTRDFT